MRRLLRLTLDFWLFSSRALVGIMTLLITVVTLNLTQVDLNLFGFLTVVVLTPVVEILEP